MRTGVYFLGSKIGAAKQVVHAAITELLEAKRRQWDYMASRPRRLYTLWPPNATIYMNREFRNICCKVRKHLENIYISNALTGD
jgi:hypothetical protein